MNTVSEAVILMAGSGSRLRGSDETFFKPLVLILGRPLICYIMDALIDAGISKVNFIVGYQCERLRAAIVKLVPPKLESVFIENPQWQKQNGISLLAAANQVSAPFLLAMSDHLFDHVIVDLLIKSADVDLLNLAVDRKINSIFDLDDAMKVQTKGNRIVAIGKKLESYNTIDTGIFLCPQIIFEYLRRVLKDDDCSLADGVRQVSKGGEARGSG